MIVTESALREQLRQPYRGARVVVPAGARLSPSARDFVGAWELHLVENGGAAMAGSANGDGERPAWDRRGEFTVVLEGEIPRCVGCGQPVTDKPDHLTQLNAYHYAPKTHPRLHLRAKLDSVNATALLTAAIARRQGRTRIAALVDSIGAYVREIVSAEYALREAAPFELDGRDDDAIHRVTHHPEELDTGHVVLDSESDELLLWLNRLRAEAREAELVGAALFTNPHDRSGASVAHGLNRLSSAVYYVELLLVAGRTEPAVVTS